MDTIVYVDGFNFYYGSLKGTPYKWLDLCAFFRRALPASCHVKKVKYFTARVSALPHDPHVADRQAVYLAALRAVCGPAIEVIEGSFKVKRRKMPLASRPSTLVEAIFTEEKGSDVNLAVELVNDAWRGAFDCAAVVSNDADLERALRIAKQQLRKQLYLFTPGHPKRVRLQCLTRWSHKQFGIDEASLAASQLPPHLPDQRITKPPRW